MAANPHAKTVLSPIFRLSYPTLITPEQFKDPVTKQAKGDPIYNMEMIYDPVDLETFKVENPESGGWDEIDLRKLGARLAKARWGADFNPAEAVRHGGLGWPFKNGDERAEQKGDKADHLKGKILVRAKALTKINEKPVEGPRLYYVEDGNFQQIVRGSDAAREMATAMFYGGAYCTAELSIVASDFGAKKYITIYINGVVFEQHGERFGTGSLMEKFRGTRGGQTDYDPTAGMSGNDLDSEVPY